MFPPVIGFFGPETLLVLTKTDFALVIGTKLLVSRSAVFSLLLAGYARRGPVASTFFVCGYG